MGIEKGQIIKFKVNLLEPKLDTTTKNGVTCTYNYDGTYTLTGTNTSSSELIFWVDYELKYLKSGTYKILGVPNNTSITIGGDPHGEVRYSGKVITHNQGENFNIAIVVPAGYATKGEVIKPMITPNLTATYDDFIFFNEGMITGATASNIYVLFQGQETIYFNVSGSSVSHERWWRKWSDGRIEQGGYIGRNVISQGFIPTVTQVNMRIPFTSRDTYYAVCNISYNNSIGIGVIPQGGHTVFPMKLYTDYFTVGICWGLEGKKEYIDRPFVWTATGY